MPNLNSTDRDLLDGFGAFDLETRLGKVEISMDLRLVEWGVLEPKISSLGSDI
jgi:hypothetical protein